MSWTGVVHLDKGWAVEYEDGVPVRMGWTPTEDTPEIPSDPRTRTNEGPGQDNPPRA